MEELVRKRACSGSRLWADRLRPGRKPTPVHFDVEQWLDTVHIGQLDDSIGAFGQVYLLRGRLLERALE